MALNQIVKNIRFKLKGGLLKEFPTIKTLSVILKKDIIIRFRNNTTHTLYHRQMKNVYF